MPVDPEDPREDDEAEETVDPTGAGEPDLGDAELEDPGHVASRSAEPPPSARASTAPEPPSPSASMPPPGAGERASRPPEDEEEGRRRQRRRLEGLLRESFRRAIEKGLEAGLGAIETGVGAVEKGVEAGRGTLHQVKGVVEDVKLPKEVASYVFSQIDETKNVLIRAVAREVRDFLDATDLAHELQRALTSLSFEIKTEIRFVPNEKGLVRPDVRAKASPHRVRDDEEDEPGDEPRRRRRG